MPSSMNLMLFVLLAVADLPPEDLTQLNTASDGTALLDEAAWYPLLRRAAGTEPEPRPGALIPDYGAIAASPQQHRGQRHVVRGILAGRRPVERLARPGPWDGRLEQWSILVQRDPDTVAVVYVVDPPEDAKKRREVELVARFYKMWQTQDLENAVTDYPVFVGRSATVYRAPAPPSGSPYLFFILIVPLALAWILIRSKVRRDAAKGSRGRRATESGQPFEPDPSEADLPKDPAEALRYMEEHREDGKK